MQDNLYIDNSLPVKHSISKIFTPFQEIYTTLYKNKLALHESIFYQSNECSGLTKTSVCIGCNQKQKKLLQRNNKSINGKSKFFDYPFKTNNSPNFSYNYRKN